MITGFDKGSGDETVRQTRCPDCGRLFELRYMNATGQAQQTWQRGCETMDACIKKYMPPSDFVEYSDNTGEQDHE